MNVLASYRGVLFTIGSWDGVGRSGCVGVLVECNYFVVERGDNGFDGAAGAQEVVELLTYGGTLEIGWIYGIGSVPAQINVDLYRLVSEDAFISVVVMV